MSDLSMYFLAIAKHRSREYLDRAHSIFFLSARLSRHTENVDCSSDWKSDPIASLWEVSGEYPCTIIIILLLTCLLRGHNTQLWRV